PSPLSYDVEFANRRVGEHALITEGAQIQRARCAKCNQLADVAPDGRGLLQSVAAEAVGKIEIVELGMQAEDGILIQCIVSVMSGPGSTGAQCLEGRQALSQRRPDHVFKQRMVDFEILAVGVGFRSDATQELIAFGAKV